MIQKLTAWLETYPGWEEPLQIDTAGPGTGLGLFPKGVETVGRVSDILGNVTEACRATVTLCRNGLGQEGDADWLLDFQHWVRCQSRAGLAPQFGTDPARERITARAGRLKDMDQGMGRYTVDILIDYVC